MEGNKNAMYMQAGRSRGWTQSINEDITINVPAVKQETIIPVVPVMPESPMMIPEPPKVIVPEAPKAMVHETTKAMKPEAPNPGKCETLAMAYMTMQKWQDIYDPEQGISCGTIFAELDLPFAGEGACKHE